MRKNLLTSSVVLALGALLAGCSTLGTRSNAVEPADKTGIVETDIATLSLRLARGETSSVALTEAYLQRIMALDDAGPQLNAVIEINPRVAEEAAQRDAERLAGKMRGPLHGIPVLLKDNIDATPMVNSAGSLALAEHRPHLDAPLVRALRDAGAVILGKTNLSEWANFRSRRSVSGWSARGGQTRNPYVLDRNPCGSSSGTAVAIAANFATVGIGTETDGSIICPAAVNGLVGLKPTVGLIGRSGIIPISHTQDTAGPMTRSVADAALMLSVLAATSDGDDIATREASRFRLDNYTTELRTDALRGVRVGVLRNRVGTQPELNAAFERALNTLRDAGATIVDAQIPNDGAWEAAELTVMKYEFKHGLNRYLQLSNAPVKSLDEVIAYNRENAAVEMPYFGQELFEQAQKTGSLSDRAYRDAVRKTKSLAGPRGIDAALRRNKLDVLIAPATGAAWLTDPVNGDHFTGSGYGPAAVAGYPSLTVPMGDVHGLPLGLVFMGAKWSEARLLGYGFAFEQRLKARKRPQFLSTLRKPLLQPPAQAISAGQKVVQAGH